ncbi:DUF445 family protein [Iodobacter sp. HSC-16F04]|uniref:DUF445 family protein n=1 Tax=Iodobacter violaceini TaxID=3044271 RepID=A0ABX0KPQ4_9NEIS|nr:DUF445 family protein [Iodobacter violacea]NHQ85569.1 DUF445 family protein [Iodobacter violacea]
MNTQCERVIPIIIEECRETIGVFISDQVKTWDGQYMAERIELNIGSDLQYIRVSGTLVDGLVGLMIYVVVGYLGEKVWGERKNICTQLTYGCLVFRLQSLTRILV